MNNRYSIIRKIVWCLLACVLLAGIAAASAESTPEGYPAVREGINFGGMDVYIYDWWTSPDYWNAYDESTASDEEIARHAYLVWLQDTYNVHIHAIARGDWGSAAQEMIDFAEKGGERDKLALFTERSDSVLSIIQAGAAAPILYDMSADRWNRSVIESTTIRKKVYGMNTGASEPRQCLFFNKRLLEEAEVDWSSLYDMQENGTWTWSALENILSQVQSKGIGAITGNKDDYLQIAVYTGGGSFIGTDEAGALCPTVDSQETKAALTWALDLWDTYSLARPYDASWDWYNAAWANGESAFYVAQAYTGFNSGFSGLQDDWGCVAFPMKQATEQFINLPSNNVIMIPSCYDEETVNNLVFIYDMWTLDTPGCDTSSWIGNKLELTDDRAVLETYAMLRDPATQIPNYVDLFGGANSFMGADLLWTIQSGNIEEITACCAEKWAASCDELNYSYGTIAIPYPKRSFAVGAPIEFEIGKFDKNTDQYVHLLLAGENDSFTSVAVIKAWDAAAQEKNTLFGEGVTTQAGQYFLTLGPDENYTGIEKSMVSCVGITVLAEGLPTPEFRDVQVTGDTGKDISFTLYMQGSGTGYLAIERLENGIWNEVFWDNPYTSQSGEKAYTILGLYFDRAGEYRIRAIALTHEPYEDPSGEIADSEMAEYEFTLTGDVPACPQVTLSDTGAEAGSVDAAFTVEGADAVTWRYDFYDLVTDELLGGIGMPVTFTEGSTDTFGGFGEPARYELTFWARIDGVWSLPSDPVDFIVYAPLQLRKADGTPLSDGDTLSGQFYYRIYADVPEGFSGLNVGWTMDVDATEPDAWEDGLRRFKEDENGKYIAIIPEVSATYTEEILFVRLAPNCPAQRYIMNYDRNAVTSVTTAVTSGNPLLNTAYELTWNPVDGADMYLVEWTRPNSGTWMIPVDGDADSFCFPTDDYPIEEALGMLGEYRTTVMPLVDGKLGTASEPKTFTLGMPEGAGQHVTLEGDRQVDEDGVVHVGVYDNVWFTISADDVARQNPGEVQFMTGDGMIIADSWDVWDHGFTNAWWMPTLEIAPYCDYVLYARVWNENTREWLYSNKLTFRVHMEDTIEEAITYHVAGSQPVELAKDDALVLTVDNVGADYYGCYILENGERIADSKWIPAQDGETTEVRMPLFGCTPGNTYDAFVYAIKCGCPIKTASEPVRVTVTARQTDSPIIISMKDTFRVGDRIRAHIAYENPEHWDEGLCRINVTVYRKADDDGYSAIWNQFADGFYYMLDSLQLDQSGDYMLEAVIYVSDEWGDAHEAGETTSLFPFRVDSDGIVAWPVLNPDRLLAEGEDLSLTVSAEATEANPAPENFEIFVYCIDRGMAYVYSGLVETEDGTAEITVPAEYFQADSAYCVTLYARRAGYDSTNYTFGTMVLKDPSSEVLVLPSSLTEIGREAFCGTAAKVVILPEGVTSIGDFSFANSGVRAVFFPSTLIDFGEDPFGGCPLYLIFSRSYVASRLAWFYSESFLDTY